MRIITRTTAVAALAVLPLTATLPAHAAAPSAHATQSCAQLVTGHKALADKFRQLQAPAQSITLVNGPLLLVGQGPLPKIISGLTDIISAATAQTVQARGSEPCTGADAAEGATSAEGLTRDAQATLNTLIGKAGLFHAAPFIGEPISAALNQLEAALDSYALERVQLYPGEGADRITTRFEELSKTLEAAVKAYQGLGT